VQTALVLNPKEEISKNDFTAAFMAAYPAQKEAKPKPKGPGNMLLKSIGKFLMNKKEKIQPMGEQNVNKMTQNLLEDKLQMDIDCENSNKQSKYLPNYILDQLSMKFGLKTIAVKNLISLKEGLSSVTKSYRKENPTKTPFSLLLTTIMGLESDTGINLSSDQVSLIVKSRPLWQEAQEQFKKNIQVKRGGSIQNFSLFDLQTGGACSVLEVIDVITVW
jgi:hypothetical protein